MRKPRIIGAVVLVGSSAAAAVLVRRRRARPKARVELYYEDGSVQTIDAGVPGADRMLALAREAMSAARPVL